MIIEFRLWKDFIMCDMFQTSQENIALIPTRTSKISTTKPAANPLQFVKVGPCDLSRFAQEQAKKAEEVKKVNPVKRDEAEDWQSVSTVPYSQSAVLCYS